MVVNTSRAAFRLSPVDKARLAEIARQLETTQTQVVRLMIRGGLEALKASSQRPGAEQRNQISTGQERITA